jgi:hypothetical protein
VALYAAIAIYPDRRFMCATGSAVVCGMDGNDFGAVQRHVFAASRWFNFRPKLFGEVAVATFLILLVRRQRQRDGHLGEQSIDNVKTLGCRT